MKESRFIELLNLYVDQELSPAEAAELEAEIAASPARRRTYEQYCRMQRGCSLLFEAVRANAPEYTALASAGHAAERKVLDFPASRPARRSVFPTVIAWSGGLMAAAAAVTVLLVREPNVDPGAQPGGSVVATTETAPAPASAVAAETPTGRTSDYQLAAKFTRSPEVAKVFESAEQPNFDWMKQIHFKDLPTLSAEDLRFVDDQPVPRARTLLKDTAQPYTPGETYNALEFRR